MKLRLVLSCALMVLMALPSFGAWGAFVSTGSTIVNSEPSCAPTSGGQAVCAARSLKNTIVVNQFNGTTWGNWKTIAGAVTSAPSCASDGNSKVICAARATNGGMAYTVFSGGTWPGQ